MPPSGFNSSQSYYIVGFLRSCTEALIREGTGIRTPAEAIRRELRHISLDRSKARRDQISTKLLEMTEAYYRELAVSEVKDFDALNSAAEELLDRVANNIEAIKVVEVD